MSIITHLTLLTPLLTATAYTQFALDETFFFSLFLPALHSAQSAALLPSYFSTFSRPAVLLISTTLGLQLLTCLGAVAVSQAGTTFCYWVGFVLTLAHFPFAPWAAPLLLDIAEMDRVKVKEEEVMDKMVAFLKIHIVRSLTANLGAWVCFAIAVVQRMG